MSDKNIQMKFKNGAGSWDNLFPKTKATIVNLDNGKSLETVISEILTSLGKKTRIKCCAGRN